MAENPDACAGRGFRFSGFIGLGRPSWSSPSLVFATDASTIRSAPPASSPAISAHQDAPLAAKLPLGGVCGRRFSNSDYTARLQPGNFSSSGRPPLAAKLLLGGVCGRRFSNSDYTARLQPGNFSSSGRPPPRRQAPAWRCLRQTPQQFSLHRQAPAWQFPLLSVERIYCFIKRS